MMTEYRTAKGAKVYSLMAFHGYKKTILTALLSSFPQSDKQEDNQFTVNWFKSPILWLSKVNNLIDCVSLVKRNIVLEKQPFKRKQKKNLQKRKHPLNNLQFKITHYQQELW